MKIDEMRKQADHNFLHTLTCTESVHVEIIYKSKWWMPRHQKTTKDVAICEKPRLGDKQPLTRGYPNGVTQSDGRSDYHSLNT